jgi:hypothetical protein
MNDDNRKQRVGDGRVFFAHVLAVFGPQESHDVTAQRVLDVGRIRYGAERDNLKGKHLRSWADGTRIVPKWAYAAALDLALDNGFEPTDDDQAIATWKTWRSERQELSDEQAFTEFMSAIPLSQSQRAAVQTYAGLCE